MWLEKSKVQQGSRAKPTRQDKSNATARRTERRSGATLKRTERAKPTSGKTEQSQKQAKTRANSNSRQVKSRANSRQEESIANGRQSEPKDCDLDKAKHEEKHSTEESCSEPVPHVQQGQYELKLGEVVPTIPAISFNEETVE